MQWISKNKKSIVLLSAGLDSLVSLKKSLEQTKIKLVITFDYGQLASQKEIFNSKLICKKYKLLHKVIKLPFLKEFLPLTFPSLKEKHLEDSSLMKKTAQQVWIPNRNAIFINVAAAFAEKLKCDLIVTGFNKEEACTFKDNSKEFVNSINKTLSFSTLNKVKVISFTLNLTKPEIIILAKKIDIPWEYLWSCYKNKKNMCLECESCVRLVSALKTTKNLDLLHKNARKIY